MGLIDLNLKRDEKRRSQEKKAFEWASGEIKANMLVLQPFDVGFTKDEMPFGSEFETSIFRDPDSDLTLMRVGWPVQNFPVVTYYVVNNFDTLKTVAPKTTKELIEKGISLAC